MALAMPVPAATASTPSAYTTWWSSTAAAPPRPTRTSLGANPADVHPRIGPRADGERARVGWAPQGGTRCCAGDRVEEDVAGGRPAAHLEDVGAAGCPSERPAAVPEPRRTGHQVSGRAVAPPVSSASTSRPRWPVARHGDAPPRPPAFRRRRRHRDRDRAVHPRFDQQHRPSMPRQWWSVHSTSTIGVGTACGGVPRWSTRGGPQARPSCGSAAGETAWSRDGRHTSHTTCCSRRQASTRRARGAPAGRRDLRLVLTQPVGGGRATRPNCSSTATPGASPPSPNGTTATTRA